MGRVAHSRAFDFSYNRFEVEIVAENFIYNSS